MSLDSAPLPPSNGHMKKSSSVKSDEEIFHMAEFRPRSKTMSEVGKHRKTLCVSKFKRTLSDEHRRNMQDRNKFPRKIVSRIRDSSLHNEKHISVNDDSKSLIRPRSYTMSDLQRRKMEKPRTRRQRSSFNDDVESENRDDNSRFSVKQNLKGNKQVDCTWDTMRETMKNVNDEDISSRKIIEGKVTRRSRSEPRSLNAKECSKEKSFEECSIVVRNVKEYAMSVHTPISLKEFDVNAGIQLYQTDAEVLRSKHGGTRENQNASSERHFENTYPGYSKLSQREKRRMSANPDVRLSAHQGHSVRPITNTSVNGTDSNNIKPRMRMRAYTVTTPCTCRKSQYLHPNYPVARSGVFEKNPIGSIEEDSSRRSSGSSIQDIIHSESPVRPRAFTMADQITLQKLRAKMAKRHHVSTQSYNGSDNLEESLRPDTENSIMTEGNDTKADYNASSEDDELNEKSSLIPSMKCGDSEILQAINDPYMEIPDLKSPSETLIQNDKMSRNQIFHKKSVRYKVSNDRSESIRRKQKSHDGNRHRSRFWGYLDSVRTRMRKWFCTTTEEEVAQLSTHPIGHRCRIDTPFAKDFQ